MKDKFLKQAEHEYSQNQRLIVLIPAGVLFLIILPTALVYFSSVLDNRFQLSSFDYGTVNLILGSLLILAGISFGLWSNYVQFTIGRGTPVPVMATQQLIIQKPYNYCRNPMAFGTIVMYFGVAVLLGSIAAVVLVIIGAVLLLVYIKIIEEKEMEIRFGEAYRVYRKQTPFLIPRFWK